MAVATDTLERIVMAALAEDVGQGDVTTEATVPLDAVGSAEILVKEPGVVCGLHAVEATFRSLDPSLDVELLVPEGAVLEGRSSVAAVAGVVSAILTGERVALNFLARLSGIAISRPPAVPGSQTPASSSRGQA